MTDARELLNTIKYVRETYGNSVLTESEVNFLEVFTKNDKVFYSHKHLVKILISQYLKTF